MPYSKVQTEKLSHAVVRQIEQLILRGILRAGERLPSERELAERLGVSRPSLREAVAELQETGLLVARPNSGIYVAEVLGSAFSPALTRLFATHDEAKFDYLDFRRDVEGLAAIRAARVASNTDLAVVREAYQRLDEAHGKNDPELEARLDAEFHMAIIEASHNVVMIHMMRSMFELLREGVFFNRWIVFEQKAINSALHAQHGAINAALQARDEDGAKAAVEAHIAYVREAYSDHNEKLANEAIAQQRLSTRVRS